MKKILKEIQSGKFTREWVNEYKSGLKNYNRMLAAGAKHPIEKTGERLRALMPWMTKKNIKGVQAAVIEGKNRVASSGQSSSLASLLTAHYSLPATNEPNHPSNPQEPACARPGGTGGGMPAGAIPGNRLRDCSRLSRPATESSSGRWRSRGARGSSPRNWSRR